VGVIPLSYSIPAALTALCKIRDYYAQFPFVRRCAIQFGQPQGQNDLASLVKNLPAFVRQKMTYIPDPYGFEFVTAPDVMLGEILQKGTAYGDCDDHVLLLNTLLASVGFPTAFVAVKITPGTEMFDHVISSYQYEGQWVDCDPCAKSVPQPLYLEQYRVQSA
jgi:predicted transglutaminase-like cysteine proteinase